MGVGKHLPRCGWCGCVGLVGSVCWTSECVHYYSRCAWVRIVLMCTGMYVCTVRTTVRS